MGLMPKKWRGAVPGRNSKDRSAPPSLGNKVDTISSDLRARERREQKYRRRYAAVQNRPGGRKNVEKKRIAGTEKKPSSSWQTEPAAQKGES